jgi:hypothetical protein
MIAAVISLNRRAVDLPRGSYLGEGVFSTTTASAWSWSSGASSRRSSRASIAADRALRALERHGGGGKPVVRTRAIGVAEIRSTSTSSAPRRGPRRASARRRRSRLIHRRFLRPPVPEERSATVTPHRRMCHWIRELGPLDAGSRIAARMLDRRSIGSHRPKNGRASCLKLARIRSGGGQAIR